MREWSLEGRERSRPHQTKIRSAVVGNSQVVGERDFRSAKCDRGICNQSPIGELGLSSIRGRQIEYRPLTVVKAGVGTC